MASTRPGESSGRPADEARALWDEIEQTRAHLGDTVEQLAGGAILSFWLYLVGTAILFGGEINPEAGREAAAQAGVPLARKGAAQVERPGRASR